MKYYEIWKVNVTGCGEWNEVNGYYHYFLMTDEDIAALAIKEEYPFECLNPYNIKIDEDLWYNTMYEIDEVVEKYPVSSLKEVLDFCRKNDIADYSMTDCCYKEDDLEENKSVVGIRVGGEKFDILTENLELIIVNPEGFRDM